MNFMRLSVISPELASLLSGMSASQLLFASAAAVDWALRDVEIADPRLASGRDALAGQEFGDSVVRSGVAELVEELDAVAWDIQDGDNSADSTAYLKAFRRARAVNALWNALAGANLEDIMDCVYEAFATGDSTASLEGAIHAMADSKG